MSQLIKSLILITLEVAAFNFHNVVAQTIINLQPDSAIGKDAHINSHFPNTNAGSNKGFYSTGWTWSGSYGTVRSFIQFDLSSIPTNAPILSANLSLFNDPTNNLVLTNGKHSNLTASNASFISRVTESWDEFNINWNNQPNYDTTNQVTLSQSTNSNQDYLNIDVTGMIQDMANNPYKNHGFVLRLQTETKYAALLFASSDHVDSTNHPKLEITYALPLSIDDLVQDHSILSFYPNPTHGKININFNEVKSNPILTLFNNKGQTLLIEKFKSTDNIKMNFDVPNGIYFLRIHTPSEEMKTIKILKE